MVNTPENKNFPREDLRMTNDQMGWLASLVSTADVLREQATSKHVFDQELKYRVGGYISEAAMDEKHGINATGVRLALSGIVLGGAEMRQSQDSVLNTLLGTYELPENQVDILRDTGSHIKMVKESRSDRGPAYNNSVLNAHNGIRQYIDAQKATGVPVEKLELVSLTTFWAAFNDIRLRNHITAEIGEKFRY